MPAITLSTVLQVIVGAGLLNVWLVRSRWSTAYRGGDSKSLREEFAVYGLPEWFFFLIGFLKIGSAIALLTGLWVPEVVPYAAAVVVGLMLGALSMHVKVKDPAIKSLPASLMLLMSAAILVLALI
jgi:hypothetical protein